MTRSNKTKWKREIQFDVTIRIHKGGSRSSVTRIDSQSCDEGGETEKKKKKREKR